MHVHITSAIKNPQTLDASSITVHSVSHFRHLAIDEVILNNNLYSKSEIICGSIIKAITKRAIIPHEFFISEMLDVIVLKASFTVLPTIGIKLLIANLAVFIDILSFDCERMLLQDNTNINIDITKTVTPVNVFFKVFDIPLKSK